MKKLFRVFTDEDSKSIEEIPVRNEQVHSKIKNQNGENGKDVEAKVFYQYPKGQFRFPLVPDSEDRNDHPLSVHEKRPIKRNEGQSPPITSTRRKEGNKPPFVEKERANISQKTKRKQEPALKQSITEHSQGSSLKSPTSDRKARLTRPFKPTMIPSPIYGFKDRPTIEKHHEQVEYELQPLEAQERFQADVSNDQEGNNLKSTNEVTGHNSDVKLHSMVQETAANHESMEDTFKDENQFAVNNELEVNENTEVLIVPEEFHENLEVAAALEEIRTIQDDGEIEEMVQGEDKDNHENLDHETIETDIQFESEPVITAERPKERSPIPFNVIMLKQDKQKLLNKRNRLIAQEGKTADILIQDTPPELTFEKDQSAEQVNIENQDQQGLEFKEPEETEGQEVYSTFNTDFSKNEQVDPDLTHYSYPSLDLLNPPVVMEGNREWVNEQSELLNSTLRDFNVGAQVVNVTQGPAVTRFEVQPEPGVKVNKITNLSDDIKLSLAARDIRIEAPIPGKHTIGIEVPNQKSRAVNISEIVNDPEFYQHKSPLTAVLGLDISGRPIVTDLRKMPHGLIAGATGSGKSVCINTILVSLLYKATPEQLKLLLIDPKMVELAPYNHIPHLVSPVITDVKAATAALKWAVDEMERRYELFAHSGVRDISRFNELAENHKQYADKLPYIVIIIDELADLMMMSPADVEEAISRIAQKARACGIHLIIATQRPSVDVITGLIKANIPTRIAFSVSSQIDSRTIIDMSGAEKLLGRGDMLFLENGTSKPVRIQGTFVSDDEIDRVVSHVRSQGEPDYMFQEEELLKKAQVEEEEDELFYEACEFVVEHGGASTSLLQRRFKIGYNRAARLIDMMEFHGYISESRGSKPRDVYLTDVDLETLQ